MQRRTATTVAQPITTRNRPIGSMWKLQRATSTRFIIIRSYNMPSAPADIPILISKNGHSHGFQKQIPTISTDLVSLLWYTRMADAIHGYRDNTHSYTDTETTNIHTHIQRQHIDIHIQTQYSAIIHIHKHNTLSDTYKHNTLRLYTYTNTILCHYTHIQTQYTDIIHIYKHNTLPLYTYTNTIHVIVHIYKHNTLSSHTNTIHCQYTCTQIQYSAIIHIYKHNTPSDIDTNTIYCHCHYIPLRIKSSLIRFYPVLDM